MSDAEADAAGAAALERVRAGGKRALAQALARCEARPDDPAQAAMLDAAWRAAKGHAIGLTGPPGVGKSTLTDALIRQFRAKGARVAVIAVDPSSRRTGGALLGDRTRLTTDPADAGVFVRSMAARAALGGLATTAWPALVLMRALFDIVIVETVGVGQSETEIADVADTVVFCAQPGAGDALQYMKAGIIEIPHLAVVTKADMGAPAQRAAADLRGALSLAAGDGGAGEGGAAIPVLTCSAGTGEGIEALAEALLERMAKLGDLNDSRARQATIWLRRALIEGFGSEGFARLSDCLDPVESRHSPFLLAQRVWRRGVVALSVGFTPQ
ncbi:ArgK/MeaB family GTPase [Rubrimonas cliftonensis]|uniref:LAO/AO transport system kinase n=1 Tax=Rubrimonas cliftonensis TaxID=89524 RepID=A0A1H3WPM3_9RHOB|nr:ATP/GTP-binding protein [Rubrimonas cliftonensis]SDZ88292.1 LAO/AO transport system kinase [Rubrimonas cliftonensis]